MLALCATAASIDPDKLNIVIDGGLEAKNAAPGELVVVNVSLSGNKGISSLWAKLTWSDKLELQNAKYAFYDENDDSAMVALPENNSAWNTVGNSFVFNWIWAKNELKEDGAFIILTFKVSSSASVGETLAITAEIDDDNLFDSNYNNVAYNLINGGVTVSGEATGTSPVSDNGTVTNAPKENGVNTTAIIIAVVVGVVVAAALVTVIVIKNRKSKEK